MAARQGKCQGGGFHGNNVLRVLTVNWRGEFVVARREHSRGTYQNTFLIKVWGSGQTIKAEEKLNVSLNAGKSLLCPIRGSRGKDYRGLNETQAGTTYQGSGLGEGKNAVNPKISTQREIL